MPRIARVFSPTRLRAARERAGLSREKLAFAAGCSASSIVQYEGGHATPSIRMLTALAGALDIEPGDLFEGPRPAASEAVAP